MQYSRPLLLTDPHFLYEPLEAKVVLLGSSGVGKTSLLARCQSDLSGQAQQQAAPIDTPPVVLATLGPVFSSLLLRPDRCPNDNNNADNEFGGRCVRLQVWDTAGGERFHSLAPLYYRSASAALLVFDLTKRETYEELEYWIGEVGRHQDRLATRLFLVGNKLDLIAPTGQLLKLQAAQYAASINAQFHATSACTGAGVSQLFNSVAAALLRDDDVAASTSRTSTQPSQSTARIAVKNARASGELGDHGGGGCAC